MSNEEYFRFRVEDDKQNDLFSMLWKGLLILILILAVVVLAIWGYKLLTSQDQNNKTVTKVIQKPVIVEKKSSLKKEELALIIKAVLEQMKKEQEQAKQKPVVTKNKKVSEDSKLLQSLQKVKVEDVKKKKPDKKQTYKKDALNKKVKEKVIKKKIVYNAVIINKKEIKSTSDLARLYASINKISRSKKRKILKSAYTKKIKKEIIIRKNSMRTIKVRKGDTLSSIARRAYGKSSMYHKIFEANPDLLSNPDNLRVGQVLRVPK